MESIDRIETDTTAFPASLRGDFHALSCLNWGAGTAAWLCETGTDGERVTSGSRTRGEAEQRLIKEEEILRMIAGGSAGRGGAFSAPDRAEGAGGAAPQAGVYPQLYSRQTAGRGDGGALRPAGASEKAALYVTQVLGRWTFCITFRPPVIHRDIKPQNVIVDGEDRCFTDLDIARTRRAEDADNLVKAPG